jgi:hypothetical protein
MAVLSTPRKAEALEITCRFGGRGEGEGEEEGLHLNDVEVTI